MSAATSSTMAVVTTLALQGECSEQQIIAHGVDHPGNALRPEVDLTQNLGRKDGLFFQSGPRQAD
jgi:hypothetical protein